MHAEALPTATRPAARTRFRRDLLVRYATVATIATFAIVGVTGVLIFFHVGESYLMGLHEWIGMAFVVAAGFHVARHLKSFTGLLAKPRTRVAGILAAAVTAAFVGAAALNPTGGNPMKQFVGVAMDAPIAALAPVAGTTPEDLGLRFAAAGIPGATAEQTLADIAKASGVEMPRLFGIVMGGGR